MDVIHLLPDNVANQIAAGEVVQQASSVIKELVENGIDAGADHIDIYIVDSGKTLIQVVDNGKGMSETDARMAFERHATSKIAKAEDVFALHTNGFRGEAVPSIAAVSHVKMRTRQHDQQLGTQICFEGGNCVGQEKDMCPAGTSFSVSNLFFNIPARRAHLLNHSASEHRSIMQEFERMALVNPSVSFHFFNNNALAYDLPVSNILQRIINVFGNKKYFSQLLPVDVDTTVCRISGYVGRPDMARKKGAQQFFFVNGRYMRHPFFHKNICDVFAELIPDGMQVPYFIYFEVDPSTIDVNIHPQKTEIKFTNMEFIRQILISAIKESLGKYNAVPVIDFDVDGKPGDIPVYTPDTHTPESAVEVKFDTSFNPFKSSQSLSSNYAGTPASPVRSSFAGAAIPSKANTDFLFDIAEEEALVEEPVIESIQQMEKSSDYYQYRGQYITMAVRSGLMFIDQHRAHVRVLYNRFLATMQGQTTASQGLLFPELLTLSASDAVLVEHIMDDLHALGFDLSPLGGGSFSVLGVPSSVPDVDSLSMLNEMIASVRDTGKSVREDVQHHLALAMARHAAMTEGEVLTRTQMESLVGDLFATQNPSIGPDGKTILAIMPQEQIDKLFR